MMNPQPSLLQRVVPLVADLAGSFAKSFVSSQLRRTVIEGRVTHVPPDVAPAVNVDESPSDTTGCPYCAGARHLAAAYRYLTRAQERPALTDIYQELALREVYLSHQALDILRLSVNRNTEVLKARITTLGIALSPSGPSPDFADCARHAWQASSLALDLAESFDQRLRVASQGISEIDAEIARIDAALRPGETE